MTMQMSRWTQDLFIPRVLSLALTVYLALFVGCVREGGRSSSSPPDERARPQARPPVGDTSEGKTLEAKTSGKNMPPVVVQPMPDAGGTRSRVRISFQKALPGVQFSREARPSLFTANRRYLVWKLTYADTLCVYDVRKAELARTFWMPRGQGPGEFQQLSGAAITDDDIVHLAEPNQAKFLRFNVKKGPLEDLTLSDSGVRPERVHAWGTQLVLKQVSGGSGTDVIGVIGPDYSFRAVDGLDLREDLGGLFFQAGRLDATRQRALFLSRYRPWVYVFDLEHNQFVNKVVYGDVDVEMPERETTDGGVTVFRPPRRVQFFAWKVVAVPGLPGRVLINAEGSTAEHSLKRSAFYEIDVATGTIVAEHDLGIAIHKITTTGRRLYVYDDERRTILTYRLHNSSTGSPSSLE